MADLHGRGLPSWNGDERSHGDGPDYGPAIRPYFRRRKLSRRMASPGGILPVPGGDMGAAWVARGRHPLEPPRFGRIRRPGRAGVILADPTRGDIQVPVALILAPEACV